MASLKRWNAVDPLAEEMTSWSPYNYVFGNPIKLVDPDGRAPCPPGVDCGDFPDDALITASNKTTVVQQVDESIKVLADDGRSSGNLEDPEIAEKAYEKSRLGGSGSESSDLNDYMYDDKVNVKVLQEFDASTIEEAPTINTTDDFSVSNSSSVEESNSTNVGLKASVGKGPLKAEGTLGKTLKQTNSNSRSNERGISNNKTKTYVYNVDVITTTRVTIDFNTKSTSKTTTRSRGSFRTRNKIKIK